MPAHRRAVTDRADSHQQTQRSGVSPHQGGQVAPPKIVPQTEAIFAQLNTVHQLTAYCSYPLANFDKTESRFAESVMVLATSAASGPFPALASLRAQYSAASSFLLLSVTLLNAFFTTSASPAVAASSATLTKATSRLSESVRPSAASSRPFRAAGDWFEVLLLHPKARHRAITKPDARRRIIPCMVISTP